VKSRHKARGSSSMKCYRSGKSEEDRNSVKVGQIQEGRRPEPWRSERKVEIRLSEAPGTNDPGRANAKTVKGRGKSTKLQEGRAEEEQRRESRNRPA
jgi:hypothetical protein